MEISENLFKDFVANIAIVNSSRVNEGDIRLTAEYFKVNAISKYKTGLRFVPLSELASVIGFGPFKRYYIENPKFGIPLISSSEMMEVNPSCEGYISKLLQKNYEKYLVEKGWILVSCSGTLGNVTIVDNRLKGFAVSQHALRVIPNEERLRGYLYTFLSSDIGQSEVKGKKSGGVIDEIYEPDLLRLSIPVIDDKAIDDINCMIDKVILLREQANDLLDEANKLVYEYNHLPELNINEIQYSDGENKIQTRIIQSSSIVNEYRLDAHFYNPIAELAINNIINNSKNNKLLNEASTPTYMGGRASRNYVGEGFGVQFLSGKNIIQIRPTDPKFLSKQETPNLEELLLQKGWILITRSGTLARTVLVWNNYENMAASEHLIRVIPQNNEIDSGYLYAFLNSDYGYYQLVKFKHGAVIDEITEDQIGETIIPIPKEQKLIGDKIRLAYDKRAEAINLEDEAQEILKQSLEG
jgi:type I restriction enzyme S subunit